MKFDLTQAYYHVKIVPESRKYLRFLWKGKVLQFMVLPFGIHTAPWIFTTLGNAVTLYLRSHGHRIMLYLDDGLNLASSMELCLHQANHTILPLLAQLGLTINYKKSSLVPSQQFTFLGYHWDTRTLTCQLPEDRLLNIKYLVGLALSDRLCSLHLLLRVLGICNAARLAVPLARAWSRHLQRIVLLHYHGPDNILDCVLLTGNAVRELHWWNNLSLEMCKISFKKIAMCSTVSLSTDASDLGWSYVLAGHCSSGRWSPGEQTLHINLKEFLALSFALRQNPQAIQGKTVFWEVDNTTALAYIRNEGGTKNWQLCQQAISLLKWCFLLRVKLVPKYVPSSENIVDDRASRFQEVEDWYLLPRVTRKIFRQWGTPEVDLMATAHSAQVPAYFAFDRLDPLSRGTDAFAQTWEFGLAYVFPPPPVILKTLSKIQQSPVDSVFLVILPWWPNKLWFPVAMQLALEPPLRLPLPHNLVVDLSTDRTIPELKRLKLTVWRLSGKGHPTQMLNPESSILLTRAGRAVQTDVISQPGPLGSDSVQLRAWTRLMPLFK